MVCVALLVVGLIDVIDGMFPDAGVHYVLIDYAARWIAGEPVVGDDAADARFMPLEEALAAVSWEETRRVIRRAVEILAS